MLTTYLNALQLGHTVSMLLQKCFSEWSWYELNMPKPNDYFKTYTVSEKKWFYLLTVLCNTLNTVGMVK